MKKQLCNNVKAYKRHLLTGLLLFAVGLTTMGQTAWTPADISTSLWLDASDATTITATAGKVSQWDDKSGNGKHAIQANVSKQPGTGVETVNMLNSITFAGDELTSGDAAYWNRTTGNQLVFAVYKQTGPTPTSGFHPFGGSYTLGDGLSSPDVAVSGGKYRVNRRSSEFADVTGTGDATVTSIVSFRTTDTDLEIRYNGESDASVTTAAGTPVVNTSSPYYIGSRGRDAAIGTMSEFIIIQDGVTDLATIQKVEGYLAHKWGLQGDLPASHPYKNCEPVSDPVAITSATTATAIDENTAASQAVYTITNTPTVSAAPYTYSISGTDASFFSVDAATGVVTLTAAPDFENKSSYSFNVTATEPGTDSTCTERNATLAVTLAINDLDDEAPVITITGTDVTQEATNTVYVDAGATATDNVDATVTVNTGGDTVLTNTVGVYTITYTATDVAGNPAIAVSRTVTVTADVTKPVITLVGADVSQEVGGSYSDAGATALDNLDGTLTVTVGGPAVLPGTVGEYIITYDAQDAAGNDADQVTRTVTIISESAAALLDAGDVAAGTTTTISEDRLNAIDGVTGAMAGVDYAAALAAANSGFTTAGSPTAAEVQAVVTAANEAAATAAALAAVVEDIAGNADTTPATAAEINATSGATNAVDGTDYAAALAAGTYADSANPTPAELTAVVDAENARLAGLAAVAEDIAGNADTTPATAAEINAASGATNAVDGTDYTAALAAGTYADSANPTAAEIEAVIDAENARLAAAAAGLAAVAEDIAGNADTTPATAAEINAIDGVTTAVDGRDYAAALAAGTYADSANPTAAEIAAVVDAENDRVDAELAAVAAVNANANNADPGLPTTFSLTAAGATDVNADNQAAYKEAIAAGNPTTLADLQAIIDAVNAVPVEITTPVTETTDVNKNVNVMAGGSLMVTNNASINGDVTIADGTNVTLEGTGTITGNVTITDGGSLIATNGAVTGTITYERTIIGTEWYLISSPVTGQDVDAFVAASNVAVSGTNQGFSNYDNATGDWTYYQTGTTGSGNLTPGVGHAVKLNAAGSVSFSGAFNNADSNTAISNAGFNGFSLIGNPYLAYVSVEEVLAANGTILEESTVWLWDQTANTGAGAYVEYNTGSSIEIAPGQGFFVQSNNTIGTDNFSVTEAMQTATTATFFRNSRTEIELNVKSGKNAKNARILFSEGTTTGFDNGYDSSIFGGVATDFSLYTRAVANGNGRNLGIQSLPNADLESMVIPVGVKAAAGTTLEFSAKAMNLPAGLNVYLEDRNTGDVTRIDNATYSVKTATALNGIGQFYVHARANGVLSNVTNSLDNVSVYVSNNETLIVEGIKDGNANVRMYSILGKQVVNTKFSANGNNSIALPKLQTGIYLVEVESAQGTVNKKLIIK